MRLSHRTHDRLVGTGFGLAYIALMAGGLAFDAARLEAIRTPLIGYGCAPVFGLGLALLLIAHVIPIAPERLGETML